MLNLSQFSNMIRWSKNIEKLLIDNKPVEYGLINFGILHNFFKLKFSIKKGNFKQKIII